MMLSISFEGWAQCPLATDPDPYDEPRGVSGYMQAFAGEPDLDRIIRFRDPKFIRSYTQNIDVRVKSVLLNGSSLEKHPLIDAQVDLLDDPVFEGRNGVIAEDGFEPIFPFNIQFSTNDYFISRSIVPTDPDRPYREFKSINIEVDQDFIAEATGIESILVLWKDRLSKLKNDIKTANNVEIPGLQERIDFLQRNLADDGDGVSSFFPFRMEWKYSLKSDIQQSQGAFEHLFPEFEVTKEPWKISFWLGGWDADSAAFYTKGTLYIRNAKETSIVTSLARPERMSDAGSG